MGYDTGPWSVMSREEEIAWEKERAKDRRRLELEQAQTRRGLSEGQASTDRMAVETVGIVGQQGKFGKVLTERFQASGYCVVGSDRDTDWTNKAVAKKADVVVIAVDMFATAAVIREIAPVLQPDQLLLDITSVKQMPCDLMLGSPASVIGLHPMWDPANNWTGQRMVISPVRSGPWLPWVENFFSSQGVKLVTMTPSEHDALAAIVQGLIHPLALVQAEVARRMKVDIEETLEIASPIYEMKLDMIGRLLFQDPKLYAGICFLNKDVLRVLLTAQAVLQELIDIIARQDLPAFEKFFTTNRHNLGSFAGEAMARTNQLIEIWAGIKKGS